MVSLCFLKAEPPPYALERWIWGHGCPLPAIPPSCKMEDGPKSSVSFNAYQNQGSMGTKAGI